MNPSEQPEYSQERLLTIPAVAEFLGVTPPTVYSLIYTEGLPTVKLGKCARVIPSSLYAWLKQREKVR